MIVAGHSVIGALCSSPLRGEELEVHIGRVWVADVGQGDDKFYAIVVAVSDIRADLAARNQPAPIYASAAPIAAGPVAQLGPAVIAAFHASDVAADYIIGHEHDRCRRAVYGIIGERDGVGPRVGAATAVVVGIYIQRQADLPGRAGLGVSQQINIHIQVRGIGCHVQAGQVGPLRASPAAWGTQVAGRVFGNLDVAGIAHTIQRNGDGIIGLGGLRRNRWSHQPDQHDRARQDTPGRIDFLIHGFFPLL